MSIHVPRLCTYNIYIFLLPSVVESERFPPTLVAPPLSLSLDPRTPLSALQLPRSPACPPEEPAPAALPTFPTVTPSSVLPNGGWEFIWGMIPQPPPPPLLLPAPGVAAPFTLPLGNETKDSWSLKQIPPPPPLSANWRCNCNIPTHLSLYFTQGISPRNFRKLVLSAVVGRMSNWVGICGNLRGNFAYSQHWQRWKCLQQLGSIDNYRSDPLCILGIFFFLVFVFNAVRWDEDKIV